MSDYIFYALVGLVVISALVLAFDMGRDWAGTDRDVRLALKKELALYKKAAEELEESNKLMRDQYHRIKQQHLADLKQVHDEAVKS